MRIETRWRKERSGANQNIKKLEKKKRAAPIKIVEKG
jgi:hypothetical protein